MLMLHRMLSCIPMLSTVTMNITVQQQWRAEDDSWSVRVYWKVGQGNPTVQSHLVQGNLHRHIICLGSIGSDTSVVKGIYSFDKGKALLPFLEIDHAYCSVLWIL